MFKNLSKKATVSLGLVIVLALTIAPLGLADNVQNDVVVGGNDTFTAGGSTTVNYRITANSGDGQVGCNASDGTVAMVTILTPAGVTATPNPITFSACATPLPVVFKSTTPGNYVITVSVSDSGTGTYNTTPAKFTLNVLAPSDSTPPVITPFVVGTLGKNGWYVSDVTVTWSVSDPESTISSTTGCDPTAINYDTAGITLTCQATSAGGTSSESVTIKRDATAPTISAAVNPAAASSGWWNISTGAPTVTYTCGDAISGINSCTAPNTFGEGAGQSHTGYAEDNAGNTNSAGVSGINVDLTAPGLTWNGGPGAGGSYYFGFVPSAPTCTANDALSGPNGCMVSGYVASVGSHTMTATAYDVAGNMSQPTRTYSVLAWTLLGFYQPVDMGGVWNTVKGGSTVPFKFEIFAGPMELTDTASVKSFTAAKVACPSTTALMDAIEFTTTGGTSLRYDPVAGQFINNWQTPKQPGACFVVTMTTQDGSSLAANFKLK